MESMSRDGAGLHGVRGEGPLTPRSTVGGLRSEAESPREVTAAVFARAYVRSLRGGHSRSTSQHVDR